jgi:hypothetical protein
MVLFNSEEDPKFSQLMAAMFFDLSSEAFRQKELRGNFEIKNKEYIVPKRGKVFEEESITKKGGYKHRRYSLSDMRKIAYALRMNGKLSDRQLRLVIMRIDAFSEPLLKKNRKKLYKKYGIKNV